MVHASRKRRTYIEILVLIFNPSAWSTFPVEPIRWPDLDGGKPDTNVLKLRQKVKFSQSKIQNLVGFCTRITVFVGFRTHSNPESNLQKSHTKVRFWGSKVQNIRQICAYNRT